MGLLLSIFSRWHTTFIAFLSCISFISLISISRGWGSLSSSSGTKYKIQKWDKRCTRGREHYSTVFQITEGRLPRTGRVSCISMANSTGLGRHYQTAGQVIQCGACPHYLGIAPSRAYHILFMYHLAVYAFLILHDLFFNAFFQSAIIWRMHCTHQNEPNVLCYMPKGVRRMKGMGSFLEQY